MSKINSSVRVRRQGLDGMIVYCTVILILHNEQKAAKYIVIRFNTTICDCINTKVFDLENAPF